MRSAAKYEVLKYHKKLTTPLISDLGWWMVVMNV